MSTVSIQLMPQEYDKLLLVVDNFSIEWFIFNKNI